MSVNPVQTFSLYMQSVSIARSSVPGALDWFQLNIMISGAVEIIYISNIDNISDLLISACSCWQIWELCTEIMMV